MGKIMLLLPAIWSITLKHQIGFPYGSDFIAKQSVEV